MVVVCSSDVAAFGSLECPASPQGKDNGLKVDPSLKCWIGNLPDGTSWKALQEHMNQAPPVLRLL